MDFLNPKGDGKLADGKMIYRNSGKEPDPEFSKMIYRSSGKEPDPEFSKMIYRSSDKEPDPEASKMIYRSSDKEPDPEASKMIYRNSGKEPDPEFSKMIYRNSGKEPDPEFSKFKNNKPADQKSKIASTTSISDSQNSGNFFVPKNLLNGNLVARASEVLTTIQEISTKKKALRKIRNHLKKNKSSNKSHMHDDSGHNTAFQEFMEGRGDLSNITKYIDFHGVNMIWNNSRKANPPHTMLYTPSPGTVNPEYYNF